MRLLDIGMNHKTAPVEIREKLASDDMLDYLVRLDSVKEAISLKTCNRVEAIVVTDNEDRARRSILSYICRIGNLSQENILNFVYIFKDLDAVRHIFRVASSLDSMVIGEPQILGQVKGAYAEAVKKKSTGVILNTLMHRAFHVAKKIRTETGICEAAVSVSYAAVELAKKIFGSLADKRVLLIGAGEMSELTARHLMSNGAKEVIVANRTFERAMELASKFNSYPISFDEIPAYLLEVDIVITSTAAPDYIITTDMLKGISRKRRNKALFFIDIAVPRDVDPEVNKLDSVYVYDIDDLKGIVQMNMEQRRKEAMKAERIIEEEVLKFKRWLETLDVVPTIILLKNKAYSVLERELKRSESKLRDLNPKQREAVFVLCKSIVEKLINDPILFLKSKAGRPTVDTYLDLTKKLFNLDQQQGERIYEDSRHKFNNR